MSSVKLLFTAAALSSFLPPALAWAKVLGIRIGPGVTVQVSLPAGPQTGADGRGFTTCLDLSGSFNRPHVLTTLPTDTPTPPAVTPPSPSKPTSQGLATVTTTVVVSVSSEPSASLDSTLLSDTYFSSCSTSTSTQATPFTTSTAGQDTMSTTAMSASPTNSGSPPSMDASAGNSSGNGSNRTLVITLSTVLSVVGVLLIAGAILICWRYRERQHALFNRGLTPIDDDEIATWKMPRREKSGPADAGPSFAPSNHNRQLSTNSVRKPPSVIVYQNPRGIRISEELSPGPYNNYSSNLGTFGGRVSLDKELPQTPIQARAPNARAGLTDEAIPGDDPFLPSVVRRPSRLSKQHPRSSHTHTRTRSSRSSASVRSSSLHAGSDMELSPRLSHENGYGWSGYTTGGSRSSSHGASGGAGAHHIHSRVYSSSSIPPRLSFGEDGVLGGLSPRPLFRDEEIGRAIG